MKLYLDSAIVIYLIEEVIEFKDQILSILKPESILYASELTRMECRVKPIKEGNINLLNDFDTFFNNAVNVIQLDKNIMEKATFIRSKYLFKTPDSIHLAAATYVGLDLFLTNDLRLNKFKELRIYSLTSP